MEDFIEFCRKLGGSVSKVESGSEVVYYCDLPREHKFSIVFDENSVFVSSKELPLTFKAFRPKNVRVYAIDRSAIDVNVGKTGYILAEAKRIVFVNGSQVVVGVGNY